ncbi:helix-turn-helix domain-containing protein [Thalassobacillus hwangdonensis]|uniref:Helix-turn-helix domain-containing protein n=1 Tax=Thalassobacillus hwangdonensis TaxID=546108 RepID=A0ABW3KYA8_9BACI
MFDYILLDCITNIKGERTISGIYHLLDGKRSSQSLQDAHAYQLTNYFGILKGFSREDLHRALNRLEDNGWIERYEEVAVVTPMGNVQVQKMRNTYEPIHFRGLTLSSTIPLFTKRLFLYIQTVTNMHLGKNDFLPVEDDLETTEWVRNLYRTRKGNLQHHVRALYHELADLLRSMPEAEAEVFTYRLTGSGFIGLTTGQLAVRFGMDAVDVHLLLHHVCYRIYFTVKEGRDRYPSLALFTIDEQPHILVTNSAKRTYELLQEGFEPEQIGQIRRLKMSTVQDHLVEIALVVPSFEISDYVTNEAIEQIAATADTLDTNRLKDINAALQQRYDYFQIRMVLAHQQNQAKVGESYE